MRFLQGGGPSLVKLRKGSLTALVVSPPPRTGECRHRLRAAVTPVTVVCTVRGVAAVRLRAVRDTGLSQSGALGGCSHTLTSSHTIIYHYQAGSPTASVTLTRMSLDMSTPSPVSVPQSTEA